MTNTQQVNTRLPKLTTDQMDELAGEYGLTRTQLIIMAVDQLHHRLLPNENWMIALTPAEKSILEANNQEED